MNLQLATDLIHHLKTIGYKNTSDMTPAINFLKGRISQLHLKDLRKGFQSPNFEKVSPDDFAEIGAGQIPMHPILKAANLSGVKHCHAEQDHSPAPLSSMEKSFDFLNG